MEKIIKCHFWKEYQGLNGWVMFCSAGSFSKKFARDYAESIGCTDEQRAICKKTMELNIGYAVVPTIIEVEENRKIPAQADTVKDKEFAAALNNRG